MTLTEKMTAQQRQEKLEALEMWIGLGLLQLAGSFVIFALVMHALGE